MVYQGFYICRDLEHSMLLDSFPGFVSLHPKIIFNKYTFFKFQSYLQQPKPLVHILLVELRNMESGNVWFSLLQDLLARVPCCKILFILEGSLDHCSYYLNQIPYTYLLPVSKARLLLKTGLDKAVEELSFSGLGRPFLVKEAPIVYSPAVFLSTEGIPCKGKKGCMVHYPDFRTEYTRTSMKNVKKELPENFIQIHKSYIINMNYYKTMIKKCKPSGKTQDKYLLLQRQSNTDELELPVGPKFEGNIQEYLLNKYAYPYVGEEEGNGK